MVKLRVICLVSFYATIAEANYFDDGELEYYNRYHPTSPIIEEINQIYEPAINVVNKLLSADSSTNKAVKDILQTSNPFINLFKYIYSGENIRKNPPDLKNVEESYDFIIVGGGTAGSVLANRLSEVKHWNILLIEAGGDQEFYTDIPLLSLNLQNTSLDWQYKTEPSEKYCKGMKGNQCLFPRGKVLGGSSVLNYMVFNKGSPYDYDNWRNIGCDGWSYDDVEKYFIELETTNIPKRYDPKYRGYGGPLSVEHLPYRTASTTAFVAASQEAGHQYIDYNGKNRCGVSFTQSSATNGTRHSSNRAYIFPSLNRNNLHVIKYGFVTKLIIKKNAKKVTGVSFLKNGNSYTVGATKEVIVSAGAINSPQLLMLSGIGPRDHLNQLGIKVVQDLPVGQNFQDHIGTVISFKINASTGINTEYFIENLPQIAAEYVKYHRGPLSSSGFSAVVFANITDNSTSAWPEVEIVFSEATMSSFSVFKSILGLKDSLYEEVFGSLGYDPGFTMFPLILRPKSSGKILLRDTNPLTHPIIFPNYFAKESDLDLMVKAVRLAQKIAKQPAMQKINATLMSDPLIACLKDGKFDSDEYWKCYVRAFSINIYHYSGTCRMGSEADSRSVVNPRLKVIGLRGLRVVDASIFPEIPAAHTNVPTYMVAEKAAAMIKEDWDNRLLFNKITQIINKSALPLNSEINCFE